jgi:hypothetical protein
MKNNTQWFKLNSDTLVGIVKKDIVNGFEDTLVGYSVVMGSTEV